jgi:hypothetical protein
MRSTTILFCLALLLGFSRIASGADCCCTVTWNDGANKCGTSTVCNDCNFAQQCATTGIKCTGYKCKADLTGCKLGTMLSVPALSTVGAIGLVMVVLCLGSAAVLRRREQGLLS